MPTTFANTIDSNPIYAKRAEEDQNGLNIDQTYAKKSELPTVNDGTLTIQKNGTTVDTFTANSSSNKTVNIEVPTKTSDLTNDSGFIDASDIPAQVQSNWNESDTNDPSYIQNKPSIPTATSDLTNDSGFITASDVPGAQEQADWNESDSSDPAYIKNKPTIPAAQVNSDWNASSGVAEILNKPSIPTATSDLTNDSGFITASDVPAAQEQADWNESNSSDPAYIKNKPSIPAAQVNSDWNASSGVAEILNKPNLATVATSGSYNDLSNKPTIPAAQVQSDYAQTDSSAVDYIKNKPTLFSGNYNDLTNKPDLSIYAESDNLADVAFTGSYINLTNKPTIPAPQVNSDWNANSGVAAILNKPTIPSATSDLNNDSGFITASDVPAAQEQADWNESNSSDPAYIKNKPTIPAAQVNSDWNASSGVAQILNKPSIPSATSDLTNDSGFITASDVPASQEQADWNESDSSDPAYIKNKPTIPPAPVQSDWNESDSSSLAYIQNKPNIPASQVQSDWTEADTADPAYILHKPEKSNLVAGTNITLTEDVQNNTLTISATGSIQSNWNETDPTQPSYIQNKPTIPAAPVQSNWNESDSSSLAYIQNKPTLPDGVPTVTSNDDGKVLKAAYSGGVGSYSWDTAPSGVPTGGTAGQVLTQTANGPAWNNVPSEIPSHTPGSNPYHWYNKVLGVDSSTGNLIWRSTFTYIDVTPSNGVVALYYEYQSAFLKSSAEVTSLTDQYNAMSCFVIQWTATSSTSLPTVPSTWHAASANPTSLTVGKTYQLSLLGTCYSIVEFA